MLMFLTTLQLHLMSLLNAATSLVSVLQITVESTESSVEDDVHVYYVF